MVIFSCFLSLLFVPKTYGQGQDKLLGLLKEELAQQMKELKGEEFPPYHMNYRVIDVTSSVVSASFGALMNSQQYRSRTLVPQIRLGDEKLDNFRFNQMGSAMSRFQGPSVARLPLDEENNEDAVRQAIWDEVKDRLKKNALGLSGGQQQRLCIARALAVQPEVLLMDEPTSALDPISTGKIEELALRLKNDYTIIIVTHNMQQAVRISDTTAFFLLGEVIEHAPSEQLFSAPADKRTEDYITGRFG